MGCSHFIPAFHGYDFHIIDFINVIVRLSIFIIYDEGVSSGIIELVDAFPD